MKKRIAVVITTIGCLLLAACVPKDLPSSKAISCARRAIEIGENYLNGKIAYDDAGDELSLILEEMDYVHDDDDFDTNKNHNEDYSVDTHIMMLDGDIFSDHFDNNSDSFKKVEDDIRTLKEDTGE